MDFIVISGLSGAGKSQTVSCLEDMGFYCVDNMPVALIPEFAELCMASQNKYERVALVTDVRGGSSFEGLFQALDRLEEMGCTYRILFVEAGVESIIKRYKESRRKHPLAEKGQSLEDSIRKEIRLLAPVRDRAEYIIDTTAITGQKLKGELGKLFGAEEKTPMSITVISFGFKYGIPIEADLVLDVRFLPNPFYITELREKTGLDPEVKDFLFGYQQTLDFMKHIQRLIGFLLPQYTEEGKTALVIAIGCTGGHHRSVAVTHALTAYIRKKGYEASENHRDMTRG